MNIDTAMILAGGLGTRFKEYTKDIPKPMIDANGMPLLIHIMGIYEKFGIHNFVILAGYKKNIIEDFFVQNGTLLDKEENYYSYGSKSEVKILDTGIETMTGGRVKKGLNYIKSEICFLTYGDGIANVNLNDLATFHNNLSSLATLTAVRPPARFGSIEIKEEKVIEFNEKNQSNEGWINGGFFVLNKEVSKYIDKDSQAFENEPLSKLANNNELNAFKHNGLFRPVDTIRELEILEAELKNNDFKFSK